MKHRQLLLEFSTSVLCPGYWTSLYLFFIFCLRKDQQVLFKSVKNIANTKSMENITQGQMFVSVPLTSHPLQWTPPVPHGPPLHPYNRPEAAPSNIKGPQFYNAPHSSSLQSQHQQRSRSSPNWFIFPKQRIWVRGGVINSSPLPPPSPLLALPRLHSPVPRLDWAPRPAVWRRWLADGVGWGSWTAPPGWVSFWCPWSCCCCCYWRGRPGCLLRPLPGHLERIEPE